MRAIVVDPHARTISEMDCGADPRQICAAIGADALDTAMVGAIGDVSLTAWIDETAALKPLPRFLLCGYARTLAGKAVILGSDLNGRTVECPLTRDEVAARVKWVAHAHALAQERAARALNAAHRRQAGGGLEFEPPEQT
jgi:hypothetical protein